MAIMKPVKLLILGRTRGLIFAVKLATNTIVQRPRIQDYKIYTKIDFKKSWQPRMSRMFEKAN